MHKITVRGKEYDLALTVGAFAEISDLCPGGEFSRINELMQQPTGKAIAATARMMVAMSKGAEDQKHFENPDYTPEPLTFEALRSMDAPDYVGLHRSFAAILSESVKGNTVEVAPSKKRKKRQKNSLEPGLVFVLRPDVKHGKAGNPLHRLHRNVRYGFLLFHL